MSNTIITLITLGSILFPATVLAHQRDVFTVGGFDYLFVVGSVNEPLVVDDKSGVDLRVFRADPSDPENSSATGAKPVEGLEHTLQAELVLGEKKKTIDFAPAYKDPGHYTGLFYPTKSGNFSYRIFGMLNGNKFDATFSCMPGTHQMGGGMSEPLATDAGNGVMHKLSGGMFTCPMEKASLGFPENSMTVLGLHEDVHNDMHSIELATTDAKYRSLVALAIGAFALAVALVARRKKHSAA